MNVMGRLQFLRKPLKLILILVLMALTTTAALVFCLQYYLDGLVMDYSMDSTAYVGSVYSRVQEYPMLKNIPSDILRQLEDSDTVDDVMITPVYSARAEGLTRVADGFGFNEALDMKLFLEGTVDSEPFLSPGGFGTVTENFSLKITANWGGILSGRGTQAWIIHGSGTQAPSFKEGDHVFLVGRYNSNVSGDVNGILLYDPEALDSMGIKNSSAFWNHSILVLPEDLTSEESEAQIQAFLLTSGLAESHALMDKIRDMFTIHEVEDMSMLLTVADGTTFITEGRELRAGDTGSRVCVISEAMAKQNGLAVGDRIRLSIADGCYIYGGDFEDDLGRNSGYPFEEDTMLDYREYGEFEIVGIYSEIDRRVGSADHFHHSRSDIFIPSGVLPESTAGAQARAVTFRVLGPDYEDFMNEFEVSLNEQGYTINLIDTGWEAVSSTFYAMSDRRALMLACAIAAFAAAVLSFDVLLSAHFRYEFALRRLLGAYPREANEIFLSGFLVTAIPAGFSGIGASFGVYCLWLKAQAAASLPVALPGDGVILAYLAGWTAAELIAAFALMLVFSFASCRKSLIQLLK